MNAAAPFETLGIRSLPLPAGCRREASLFAATPLDEASQNPAKLLFLRRPPYENGGPRWDWLRRKYSRRHKTCAGEFGKGRLGWWRVGTIVTIWCALVCRPVWR